MLGYWSATKPNFLTCPACLITALRIRFARLIKRILLELWNNLQEADTQMFLHTLHASDAAHQQILIKSSDTHVDVLACYFREYRRADIFLLSDTRSRARVIIVTQVCEQLRWRCVGHYQAARTHWVRHSQLFCWKRKKVALDIEKADEQSRASIYRISKRVPPMREDLRKM